MTAGPPPDLQSRDRWQIYDENWERQSGAPGRLLIARGVHSPQRDNYRDILAYLPPSYPDGGPYPVLYLHDGQNLFDDVTSYVGAWHAENALNALAAEGHEAIAIGISHMGQDRVHEFSPFADAASKGFGDEYLQFVVETVKPLVDTSFPTCPDRDHTALIGSSMGGLISLYGFFEYGEVFSMCGALSPALWFGQRAIYEYMERAPRVKGRIYLDIGTSEGYKLPVWESARFVSEVRRARDVLIDKGYADSLRYVEEEGGRHHETDWGRRLPDALRFLLAGS